MPTLGAYEEMWGRSIIPTVEEAVTRFTDGWAALNHALQSTTDQVLERKYEGHPYKRGDRALAALLNEVSHHGTQICVLRDFYANDPGARRSTADH